MNLIKLPKTEYDSYSDQMKFNLTWKINIFIFATNLILLPILFFLSINEFFGLLFSSVLAFIYQLVLYQTRRYEVIAVIWVIIGVLSTGASLLLVPTLMHLTDIIFMFLVITYAFFTLGRWAGVLVTAGNLTFLTIYLVFQLKNDQMNFQALSLLEISKTIVMSVYGFTLVTYVIFKYLDLSRYVTDKFIVANAELQETNQLVQQRNEEKTVMLKEIHHRVKNNLQVITSLLRLQSLESNNQGSEDMFNEAIRRVAAMSLIHEKMYQTDDLRELNFEDYLTSLSNDLISSYAITKDIKLTVTAPPIDLANRHFVPFALLCNELISNSLKHAFEKQNKGNIQVKISELSVDKFEMRYCDNGDWKPPKKKNSFGMELIDTLTEQLNGSVQLSIDQRGTCYTFTLENLNH
ncbi:MAG: sensor histidine kinase [Crocinitomicaceae bacterium]